MSEVEDGVVHAEGVNDYSDHVRTNCVCRVCNHVWHPKKFDYNVDD